MTKRFLAGALAAAALAAAGCGGDDDETTTAPTTTTSGATGATGATGAEGSSELAAIQSSLEDEGYDTDVVEELSNTGPAADNDAEEGITVFKGDLIAEVFIFPTPQDAEGYVDDVGVESQGSPTAVVGSVGFSAAIDDSQEALDRLVEDSGAS